MLDNCCYSRRPAPVTRANGDETPEIDWHHLGQNPFAGQGLSLAILRQAWWICRCREGASARASARGRRTLLFDSRRGFSLIAGKVNACLSLAFSQANPTVEMHGA